MEHMYFVTVLEKNGSTVDEHNWPALGASYVYGYYQSEDLARKAISDNADEIYQDKYEYICVEKMLPMIYPDCLKNDRFWMKYNHETHHYENVDETKNFIYCNLALGQEALCFLLQDQKKTENN